MKVFKIVVLIVLFSSLTASKPHKYYVSITNIEYVQESESLQIITKIFIDDLQEALRERYDTFLEFDEINESVKAEEYLKKYFSKKFSIKVDGELVSYDFIGKEYDIETLVCYIEVTNVNSFKTIEIKNEVLMDLFPEQQNIIHLKTESTRRSIILEKDESVGVLNFN